MIYLVAIAVDVDIDPAVPTPLVWRDLARQRRPRAEIPVRMTDGASPTYQPWQLGDMSNPSTGRSGKPGRRYTRCMAWIRWLPRTDPADKPGFYRL